MSEQDKSTNENKRFIKAKDRYADLRSSGYSLIIIAILGYVVLILDHYEILPVRLNVNQSWIFPFALISLFTIFIISGIFSLRSAKKIKGTISDEEVQSDTITTWILDNIHSEKIDILCEERRLNAYASLTDSDNDENTDMEIPPFESFYDIAEELKSFEREEVMTELISKQFDIDDASYISSLLEEVYDEIFS